MKIEKFIEQLNNDHRIICAEYNPKSRWKYVVELDSKKYGLLSYRESGFSINKSFIEYNEPYYSFVLYSNTQEELLDDLKEIESIKTEQELANISEENKLKAIKDRINILNNSINSETKYLIELKRKYQIDIEKKEKYLSSIEQEIHYLNMKYNENYYVSCKDCGYNIKGGHLTIDCEKCYCSIKSLWLEDKEVNINRKCHLFVKSNKIKFDEE